ncbi:MAG TPA: PA14 domain-containing protein, partial [Archangium sp.]|nr:PA14 domain-containing protein [Archangium sp.]
RANASGLYTFDWQVPASTTLLGAQEFTASYNGYAAPGSTTGLMPSSASGRMTIAFPNGAVCNGQKDCASGNCVDGVCCNSACGGSNTRDCQACSRIAGATTDGTCGTVRAGFSCRQSLGYCDSPEVCDGSNTACPGDTVTTNGTTCTAGAGSCSNGQCVSPSRGLRANYFNNITLEGTPVYRPTNSTMDFNWGTGSPDPINNTVTVDNFSARWMGDIFTPENPANEVGKYDGLYTFETLSDEGVKLWVDGKQIINNWTSHLETTDRGSIRLEAGKRYSVVLEYFEGQQNARLKLSWQPPSTTTMQVLATPAAPAAATLTPAVNNVLPVRIKSPLDRTTYTANATINIDVETIGLGSTISKVEFFQDGSTTPFSTDTTAPYSAQRTGLAPGVYVFTARTTAVATTTTGNVTLVQNSAPVAVTVIAAPTTTSNNSGQGLTADYYDGVGFNLSNFMFTRSEQVPGPDYSANPVPADVVRPNAFSVRLTGTVVPVYSQAYTFLLQTSGSAKVYINNQTTPIIDSATGLKSLPITGLTAGQLVPIRIEYSHNSATVLPLLKLSWESSSEPTSVIPTSRLYPAIQSSR